jgi:cysteine desulfurase
VAELLNTSPSSIFFTSGGTEADNCAIVSSIEKYKVSKAITSPLEHHAVLHTLENLQKAGKIELELLNVDANGNVDLEQLSVSLERNPNSFVSLMHGNNEIGNLNPVLEIAEMVKAKKGIFHSDTVQTVGHFKHDLNVWKADFMVGAGHKFHGPKGIGFLYISPDVKIDPIIHGGAQERNMRGGTENVYGIIGLAKSLEIAYQEMEEHHEYIQGLKTYMMEELVKHVPGIEFNGETNPEKSLYTVLNVSFPEMEMAEMLLFSLDIAGISASGGSACSSGTNIGSHVLNGIHANPDRPAVRFSFSKLNTREEIDYVVEKVKELCSVPLKA